jgi:hypothetical protein
MFAVTGPLTPIVTRALPHRLNPPGTTYLLYDLNIITQQVQ